MPVLLVLQIILSFVVAYYVGTIRRIGFGWSLLFCLTTSVLIGYFITCLSSKKTDPPYTNTKAWHTGKLIAGGIFMIYGVFLLARLSKRINEVEFRPQDAIVIALPFTLILLGLFMGWYTSTALYNKRYDQPK